MQRAVADIWLPARESSPGWSARLVILPHAGSGAKPWLAWSDAIPSTVEVRVARLPGRETRLAEPALMRADAAVDALADALSALPPLPTVLFGHSLGARLGFAICQRRPGTVHALIASGSAAPDRPLRRPRMAHLPDVELARQAQQRWGNLPAEILDQPKLLSVFLPALRGDLGISEDRSLFDPTPLALPVLVVSGLEDPELERADVDAWAEHTSVSCIHLRHAGGHMAILEDEAVRLQIAAACLEWALK